MRLRVRRLPDAGMPERQAPRRARALTSFSNRFRPTLAKVGWSAVALVVLSIGLAQATTYVYDGNGRLRAATNSTGASAVYVYDAMGNLLHVDSVPVNQLKIFAFSPSHGPVGTTVTISGQGFSATVANDVVQFNGATATVTKASATSLSTSVPTGATTGQITVTVGTQTATSDDVFTVDSIGQAPVITSFSPSVGGIGTNVTVVGKNLDPVANQTSAAINGWRTAPSAATDTQIQFAVQPHMGSGKVSAITPFGIGVSSADFYVTPPGIAATNVAVKKRIATGGSTGTITIPAGEYAAIVFDWSTGSWLSLQASGISSTANNINYTIYDTRNNPLMSGTLSATFGASIHLPALPMTGTYSIWIQPDTASASLTLALETDKTLSLNSPLTTSTTGSGQSKRLFFSATAGQTLGFQVASQTTSPTGSSVEYAISGPQGQGIAGFRTTAPSTGNLANLSAGTYTVLVTPDTPATVTSQLELVSGVTANVTVNGSPVTLANKVPGQYVYLSFTTTTSENLGLGISGLTVSSSDPVYAYVYDSQGNYIGGASEFNSANGGGGIDLGILSAGAYQVVLEPLGYDSVSFTATLSSAATGTLPVNTQETVNLARPGQTGEYSFTGIGGQAATLEVGSPTTVPAGNAVNYTVSTPDGKPYLMASRNDAFVMNMPILPQSGTYWVHVVPNNGATLSESLELASGVTGVNGTLAVDGSPASFATTTPGESMFLSFTAASGDSLGLGISGLTVSSGGYAVISVYDANGNSIAGTNDCYHTNDGCGLQFQNLAAGTYLVEIDPSDNDTMNFMATLSHPVTGTLSANTPLTVNLSRRGQSGKYSFVETAGRTIQLQISGISTIPSGNYVYYVFYNPDGTILSSPATMPGDLSDIFDLSSLPQSGTYTFSVSPNFGATLSEQISMVMPITGTLVVNGPAQNFTTTLQGQTVDLNFTANAGDTLSLQISALEVSFGDVVNVDVYDANGNFINSANGGCYPSYGGCTVNLANLTGGAYQAIVTPMNASDTMQFTAAVTKP